MKTTPFIKRLFASVFTAVTLATLATVSLNQSAFAEVVDEESLTSMEPVIVGMMEPMDTIENVKIEATGEDFAILNYMGTITTINNVKIDLSEGEYAYGIQNGEMSSITTISNVDITVSASEVAYGICNTNATIGTITGADIVANSDSGKVYGFYNGGTESTNITSFSGNITATTADGTATALYLVCGNTAADYTFNFNGDTTLTATATGDKGTAYSLYGTSAQSYTLTADSYSTTIALNGDIKVYSGWANEPISLTLDSGTYVVSAGATITVDNTASEDLTGSYLSINEGACLTLLGDTTFDVTNDVITLNVETLTAAAMLVITEGASVDGLSDIYIILSGDAAVAGAWDDAMLSTIISDAGGALNGISYTVYSGSDIVSTGVLSSIPEPSTATLSLPALAGLCARRRRCRKAA